MSVIQSFDLFLIIFLSAVLICAGLFDFRIQKIPNLLTLPAAIFSLGYHALTNGFSGFLFSVQGLALGIGLLIIPYLLGGMGAGDAKLMGAVGGVLGAKGVFCAFLFSALIGGIYAVILTLIYRRHFRGFYKKQLTTLINFLLIRKYIPDSENSNPKKPRLCYGLAIALGTGIYIIFDLSGYGLLS
jgi:prepilin peptidase CpaA